MPSLTDRNDRHVVIDRRQGEYLCFPDVVRADTGRLIVAYNEAEQHIQPARRVLLVATSDDNGATWSEPLRLPGKRSHCPRIVRLDDGELILTGSSRIFHHSRDHGVTWQTRKATGILHDMVDRVLHLGGDTFLTTGHLHRGTAAQPAIRQAPSEQMVYRSEDRCQTWQPVSVIGRERNLVLCEASMVRHSDGRILSLMRENSFVYEPMYLSMSEDEGETWTDPMPTPLIGHRPTMGFIDGVRLLVTYRDVGPDMGTCAWTGSLDELMGGFAVHGRHQAGNPELTGNGLRVVNGEGRENVVRYVVRPFTDPRLARATLEAEVRVDRAGENGCGLRLGTWWRIYPDRIVPEVEESEPIAIEPGRFHVVRLEYEDGDVALFVNGEHRAAIRVDSDHADTRPILFGAPYPFEDNGVDCTWKRVHLTMDEPLIPRQYEWEWQAGDGFPDQWVQDNVLELRNDRYAAAPDFGYSGWTRLDDGSIFCAYHHGGGRDAGYDPMFTAYVAGTRFSLDDFK